MASRKSDLLDVYSTLCLFFFTKQTQETSKNACVTSKFCQHDDALLVWRRQSYQRSCIRTVFGHTYTLVWVVSHQVTSRSCMCTVTKQSSPFHIISKNKIQQKLYKKKLLKKTKQTLKQTNKTHGWIGGFVKQLCQTHSRCFLQKQQQQQNLFKRLKREQLHTHTHTHTHKQTEKKVPADFPCSMCAQGR